jgi:hypothetical protein
MKTGGQEMPDNKQEQTDAMDIGDVVKKALLSYRCSYTVDQIDDISGLPLADMLTPPGDSDVSHGKAEIEALADYLAAELIEAGYAAALEAGKAVDEKCGQGIQFGRFIMGCGRTLDTPRETYRCYDCDVAFHKNCLKQHCTERKHGEK